MATDEAIMNAIEMLADQLPVQNSRQRDGWETRTLNLWRGKLKDISDPALAAAIDEVVDKCEWFPTWPQLQEAIDWHALRHEPLEYDWTAHTQEETDDRQDYFKNYANYYRDIICTDEYQKRLQAFLSSDRRDEEDAVREFYRTLNGSHGTGLAATRSEQPPLEAVV